MLYIILFLHQTTTSIVGRFPSKGCISSYSYIKPQLPTFAALKLLRCISSYSYIKPQQLRSFERVRSCCISSYSYIKPQHCHLHNAIDIVVYHPIPTSNHNIENANVVLKNVVYHPIPTSNHNSVKMLPSATALYIILFLHQTTTLIENCLLKAKLYIILFLHQTTTNN